jgi:DNA repair exonuclease SbcCD nuclease subunit
MTAEDDVAFKLLHTADWHLGKKFPTFEESAQTKLRRARLDVLREVFAAATRNAVDAVLCAGDLFDGPAPGEDWWRGLLELLTKLDGRFPPVFLLPGNHDPLMSDSVWMPGHPFRDGLPSFVHVIDREDFREEIKPGLVLYGVPCASKAGSGDPVEKIPERLPGDTTVRVGLVHGTTFDLPNCETNFPIRAGAARARGLDYLAVGDTHGYRIVQTDPYVVYPGAPEPTAFDEIDPGHVALVLFTRAGGPVRLRKLPVARWRWRDEMIRDLPTLRALEAEDLSATVLRLSFDLDVDLRERDELDRILDRLRGNEARDGRAGVLEVRRGGIRTRMASTGDFSPDLPPVISDTVSRLRLLADGGDPAQARHARIALEQLWRLTQPRTSP